MGISGRLAILLLSAVAQLSAGIEGGEAARLGRRLRADQAAGSSVRHEGCFLDKKNDRLFTMKEWIAPAKGSVAECARRAKGAGFKVFAIEYINECWYGNDHLPAMTKHGGSDPRRCSTPCDDGENCGGLWAASVYSILPAPTVVPSIVQPRLDPLAVAMDIADCEDMGAAKCAKTVYVPVKTTCEKAADDNGISLAWLQAINNRDACSLLQVMGQQLCVVPEPTGGIEVGTDGQVQPLDRHSIEPGCTHFYVTRFREDASYCSALVSDERPDLLLPPGGAWPLRHVVQAATEHIKALNWHSRFACPECGSTYQAGTFICVSKAQSLLTELI